MRRIPNYLTTKTLRNRKDELGNLIAGGEREFTGMGMDSIYSEFPIPNLRDFEERFKQIDQFRITGNQGGKLPLTVIFSYFQGENWF